MKQKRNIGTMFLTMWNAVAIISILGFFVFSVIIGGNPFIGYIENDHYFVGNHGEYIEVSETLWMISRVWETSFWIFLFLTPIVHLLFQIPKKR